MANEGLFSGRALGYHRYRAGFPVEMVDWLLGRLPCGAVVADVGAGTGLFTEVLLGRGGDRLSRVFAVEPNADMRGVLIEGLGGYDNLAVVGASAEETGLDRGSVDMITAARAFHWFDPIAFKAECRRVLKPGGVVAVLGVGDHALGDLGREVAAIKNLFSPRAQRGENQRAAHLHAFKSFFKDGAFEEATFPGEHRRDLESFVGDALSRSYAPKPNEPRYGEFVEAFERLFEKYAVNGEIVNENEAVVSVGEV